MDVSSKLEFNQNSIIPGVLEATKAFDAETEVNAGLKATMEQRFGEPEVATAPAATFDA